MLPLIIAEELLTVRKALTVLRTANNVSNIAAVVLPTDNAKYNDRLVLDEEMYFYILIAALHHQATVDLGIPLFTESTMFDVVDEAISASLYTASAIDGLNRVAAFTNAFATSLVRDSSYDPTSLKHMLQMMNKKIKPDVVYIYLKNSPDLELLKRHLTKNDVDYDVAEFDSVVKYIVDNYNQDIIAKYSSLINRDALFMFETIISALISAVNRLIPLDGLQYQLSHGTLIPSASLIPIWKSEKFPFRAFITPITVVRQDVIAGEERYLSEQRNWVKDEKGKWAPPSRASDAPSDVVTTVLATNAVTKGLERAARRMSKGKQAANVVKTTATTSSEAKLAKKVANTIANIATRKTLGKGK